MSKTTEQVRKTLAARYRAEKRFRAFGMVSVMFGLLAVAVLFTDIISKGTDLLVSGDAGPVERALDERASEGVIALPDVMSRKKQVAPKLLSAF